MFIFQPFAVESVSVYCNLQYSIKPLSGTKPNLAGNLNDQQVKFQQKKKMLENCVLFQAIVFLKLFFPISFTDFEIIFKTFSQFIFSEAKSNSHYKSGLAFSLLCLF